MEIQIDIGYNNINTLLSEITRKMSAATTSITRDSGSSLFLSRKFGSEDTPIYEYNINENYEVSI
jgi:hypothetical protein